MAVSHLYLVVDITSDKTLLLTAGLPGPQSGPGPGYTQSCLALPGQQHLPSPPSTLHPPSHRVILGCPRTPPCQTMSDHVTEIN